MKITKIFLVSLAILVCSLVPASVYSMRTSLEQPLMQAIGNNDSSMMQTEIARVRGQFLNQAFVVTRRSIDDFGGLLIQALHHAIDLGYEKCVGVLLHEGLDLFNNARGAYICAKSSKYCEILNNHWLNRFGRRRVLAKLNAIQNGLSFLPLLSNGVLRELFFHAIDMGRHHCLGLLLDSEAFISDSLLSACYIRAKKGSSDSVASCIFIRLTPGVIQAIFNRDKNKPTGLSFDEFGPGDLS